MNKKFFILTILALSVFIASCQKHNEKTTVKKTLQLIFQEGDPPSLHPHRNISHIRCVSLNKFLFEGLTRIDSNQKPILAGASSVHISKDHLEYTFTIRDCNWSNGDPITAYDYENAWKSAVSPVSLCLRPDLFYVIKNGKEIRQGTKSINKFGVKALNKKTLHIKLEHPCFTFLELLSNPIFSPLKNPEAEPSVFNGSHTIDKWNKTKNLILTKNLNYWDNKSIHLDKIEINFIADISTSFSLFQLGKVDWIGSPISYISLEEIQSLKKKNLFKKRPSTLIFWVHVNTAVPHLQSKHIRKALSYAIDRTLINNHILKGDDPISFLPNSMAPFEQSFEYNPDKAKKHFAKGLQELQITQADFPEIELSFFNLSSMKILAQYLEQTWQKTLNIRVRLVGKDWNYFRSSQEKGDFELGGCYESVLFPDPIDLLQKLEKKQGWDNKDYQKAIINMKTALTPHKKKSSLKKALKILDEEMPLIVISNSNQLFAVNSHLKGYFFDYTNGVDFSRAYFKNQQ